MRLFFQKILSGRVRVRKCMHSNFHTFVCLWFVVLSGRQVLGLSSKLYKFSWNIEIIVIPSRTTKDFSSTSQARKNCKTTKHQRKADTEWPIFMDRPSYSHAPRISRRTPRHRYGFGSSRRAPTKSWHEMTDTYWPSLVFRRARNFPTNFLALLRFPIATTTLQTRWKRSLVPWKLS